METREEMATGLFRSGLNCAQSVLSAFSEDLNFDSDSAKAVACGFGAGMGRLQGTCGVVTGAYMVLGVFNFNRFSENTERKEKTYSMVRVFNEKFVNINGSSDCRTLLNCDISSEEGHTFAKENKLFEKQCEKYLTDSIKLVQEIIR